MNDEETSLQNTSLRWLYSQIFSSLFHSEAYSLSAFQSAQGESLLKVKEILESRGFVLISGRDMKKLLVQQGATEEDMAVLESGYIHKHLPLDQQPVMHHRQVSNCGASFPS